MEMNQKKMTTADVKKNMNNWKDRDAELVTGIFKNLEMPGGSITFNYKAYPDEEYGEWYFVDGEKYTIPRGVAKHLNTQCYYLEHKLIQGQEGQGLRMALDGRKPQSSQMITSRKIFRFQFNPTDFSYEDDIDMKPTNVVTVSIK